VNGLKASPTCLHWFGLEPHTCFREYVVPSSTLRNSVLRILRIVPTTSSLENGRGKLQAHCALLAMVAEVEVSNEIVR
jgi:hypothetical protein